MLYYEYNKDDQRIRKEISVSFSYDIQGGEPMNISKFTQKSVQAVQDLEKVAYEYGNQEVEQEHLLYALLTQEDSLILKLIEKMEINKDYFINTVKKALDAKVKVSGGDLRFGQYLNKSLVNAENEAKAMGDEYVSVEHLFLSLLTQPQELELIRHLAALPSELDAAAKAYDPSKVTKYATELATLFHKFYDVCSIKYAETPELKQARLLLCEAARQGVANTLRILKVTCPEKM